MRVLLIVNPTASSVTPRAQAAIVDALGVDHDLEVALTSSRNHASELARDAAAAQVDVVVVLAGDGTLNEAAQGLVGTDTALAPLPGGSTNVFARTLGVAYDPLSACAQLLRTLEATTPQRVGVGVARTDEFARHFLFHLGVGFDAAAVREMEERHTHLKRHLAHPAFALATVETWLRGYDRTTEISVTTTGRDGAGPVTIQGPYAVVSNSDPYTYVGRRAVTLAPDAALDGPLAVTVFDSLRVSLLVRAALSAAARARFVEHSPDITQVPDVWQVSLASERPFPWQVDGDHLGSTTRIDVGYEADCLSLVVPREPRGRHQARR